MNIARVNVHLVFVVLSQFLYHRTDDTKASRHQVNIVPYFRKVPERLDRMRAIGQISALCLPDGNDLKKRPLVFYRVR